MEAVKMVVNVQIFNMMGHTDSKANYRFLGVEIFYSRVVHLSEVLHLEE